MKGKVLPFRRVQGDAPELSDDALLAACALGDQAALGALFDRFYKPLYRLLSRYSGHSELDDLVQRTFLAVQESASKYRKEASVRSWIFGIAVNVARHHVRDEGRRRHAVNSFAREVGRTAARPDDLAARQQQLARLQASVCDLPHDLRVVFIMCDLEEISGVEVARILGTKEGTVWRRLHDARRALRAAIERKSP